MNAHNKQHDSASPVVKQNLTTQPAAAQEAVAVWTVTREGDPTFPRTYFSEAAADAMVAHVTLAPFAVKHASVTAAPALYGVPDGKGGVKLGKGWAFSRWSDKALGTTMPLFTAPPAASGIDMGVSGATLTIDGKTFTVDEVRAALDAQPSPVVKQNLTTTAAQEAAGEDAYDDALDQLWKLTGGNDHPVYKRFLDFRDSFAAAPGIDLRSQMLRLAEKWEKQAAEHGVRQFTGNDHLLFANELRAQIDASPKGALNEQFVSAEGLDSPKGGSDDAALLDWMDANGFTAYRQIDPIDGLSGHCVVVHETMRTRRGNVHDTIRGAIRAAMQAQAGGAEVQP